MYLKNEQFYFLQKLTAELEKEEGQTKRVRRLIRLVDDLHDAQQEKREYQRKDMAMRRKTNRNYGQRKRERSHKNAESDE